MLFTIACLELKLDVMVSALTANLQSDCSTPSVGRPPQMAPGLCMSTQASCLSPAACLAVMRLTNPTRSHKKSESMTVSFFFIPLCPVVHNYITNLVDVGVGHCNAAHH